MSHVSVTHSLRCEKMIEIVEKPTKHVPGETSLFITFDYDQKKVNFIRTLDCAYFHKQEKQWEVPLGCLQQIVDEFTTEDDISIKPLTDQPSVVAKPVELSSYKTELLDYQREGVQYGLSHDKCLLLDEPGLGKAVTLDTLVYTPTGPIPIE